MKNSYKKYEKYIIGLGMILFFMLLVFLATYNQFDRAKAAGTWRATYLAVNFGDGNGIAWYAIFIMTGVIYAVILGYLEFKRAKINPDILWDGLLYTLPLAIIGARLWYVFADILKSMSLGQLQNNAFIREPLLIFGITNQGLQLQGLAIHGAIVVTVVFLIFFTRWKKISYWYVLDVVGPGFMIGQAIGRWGNFINRELYGPVMNFYQWMPNFIRERMDFALGDTMVNTSQPPEYHHPVFLYESSWNLIGLIVIISLRHKRIFKVGDIISFYLVWYGIGRIPVELLRILESGLSGEPLAVGGLSISILTSIGLILTGVAIFLLRRFYFKSKDGYYTDYGKEAILFDLDGTLLDTKEFIFEIVVETFKKYKPEVKLTEKDLLGFFGPTLEESFSKYEENKEKRD
ncbi:MAG TPA: prolipoprotein diacylglyceryl transferase, partial [Acholeplasma sp.]|nr:prolipoprotein diacylglyceryl transferase [Acholeplasma sp.]